MTKATEDIFCEIFHTTDTDSEFTSAEALHRDTGISLYEIRNCFEDLKELGFIIEEERGVQLTSLGKSEAGTRWVD